jgi:hypothetical protein
MSAPPRALDRLPDWEARLRAFLVAEKDRPYDWVNHCLIFCAGAVEAVTGADLSAGLRGRETTAVGARKRLRALGFATPEELLDSLLPARAPAFARRGDLVMGADGVPGLCLGGRAAFVGEAGLLVVRGHDWARAWSVGET